jgi:hypothetical protein
MPIRDNKRDVATLPPPTIFLTVEEVAARWRRRTLTTSRLLQKFNVPVYRIASKALLYAVKDIEAIEAASRNKPPQHVHSVFKPGEIPNPTGKNKP